MNRYVKTDKGVVDTNFLYPHMECYLIEDNVLYVEEVSGRVYAYANIIDSSNNVEDLLDEGE